MGRIIVFVIWGLCGCIFWGMGICALFFKKPMGFWANDEVFEVTDLKKYNRAMAVFYFIFGAIFILLGVPMLIGSLWTLFTILGVAFEGIISMVIYSAVIEKKFKK